MGWGYIDEEPSWQPPKELPNLKGEKIISLDTETYDPRLMERGPGNVFDDGRIIGMSVAVSESAKWYLPIDVLGTGAGFPINYRPSRPRWPSWRRWYRWSPCTCWCAT